MNELTQVVKQLHKERSKIQAELNRLDAAISALSPNGIGGVRRAVASRPRGVMSAAGRRRIAAIQRARWAKWRAKQKKAA